MASRRCTSFMSYHCCSAASVPLVCSIMVVLTAIAGDGVTNYSNNLFKNETKEHSGISDIIVEVSSGELDDEEDDEESKRFTPTVAPATPHQFSTVDQVLAAPIFPSLSLTSAVESAISTDVVKIHSSISESIIQIENVVALPSADEISGSHPTVDLSVGNSLSSVHPVPLLKPDIVKTQLLEQLMLKYTQAMDRASKSADSGLESHSLLSSTVVHKSDPASLENGFTSSDSGRPASDKLLYDASKVEPSIAGVPIIKADITQSASDHLVNDKVIKENHSSAKIILNSGPYTIDNELDNQLPEGYESVRHIPEAVIGKKPSVNGGSERHDFKIGHLDSDDGNVKDIGHLEFRTMSETRPSFDGVIEQDVPSGGAPEPIPLGGEDPSHGGEDEGMLSFNEWKDQQKQKTEHSESSSKVPGANGSRKKSKVDKNYASVECGAKILSANPEASGKMAILNENKDEYMLSPCSAKIWFVVELCERIQVHSVDLANFEMFSSVPERFSVYISGRYPTKDWEKVETFLAKNEREVQKFEFQEKFYARYIKIEIKSYFGQEHYCPLSLFRIFGTSEVEEIEDSEENDVENAAFEDSAGIERAKVPVVVEVDHGNAKSENSERVISENIFASAKKAVLGLVNNVAKSLAGNSKAVVNKTNVDVAVTSNSSIESGLPELVTLVDEDYGDEAVIDAWKTKCPFNGDASVTSCGNVYLQVWIDFAFRKRMCPAVKKGHFRRASNRDSNLLDETQIAWDNLSLSASHDRELADQNDRMGGIAFPIPRTGVSKSPGKPSADVSDTPRSPSQVPLSREELGVTLKSGVELDADEASVKSSDASLPTANSFAPAIVLEIQSDEVNSTVPCENGGDRHEVRSDAPVSSINDATLKSSPGARGVKVSAVDCSKETLLQVNNDVDIIVFDMDAGVGVKVGEIVATTISASALETTEKDESIISRGVSLTSQIANTVIYSNSVSDQADLASVVRKVPSVTNSGTESHGSLFNDSISLLVASSFEFRKVQSSAETRATPAFEFTLPESEATFDPITLPSLPLQSVAARMTTDVGKASSASLHGASTDLSIKTKAGEEGSTPSKVVDKKEEQLDVESDNVTTRLPGTSGSKESVIVKLNARVKALEMNLTMSMTYLEVMSDKYRKAMHEVDKKAECKIAALNDSLEFQRDMIMKQTELIAILSQQVDLLTNQLHNLKNVTAEQHEKMSERHFAWVFVEVIFVFLLLLICRPGKRQSQKAPDALDVHRRYSVPSMPVVHANGYALHERVLKHSSDSDVHSARRRLDGIPSLHASLVGCRETSAQSQANFTNPGHSSVAPVSRRKRKHARRSLVMASELAAHEQLMEEASRELGLSKTAGLLFRAGKGIIRGITGALYRQSPLPVGHEVSRTPVDPLQTVTKTLKRSRSSELPAIVESPASFRVARPKSFDDSFKATSSREFHCA